MGWFLLCQRSLLAQGQLVKTVYNLIQKHLFMHRQTDRLPTDPYLLQLNPQRIFEAANATVTLTSLTRGSVGVICARGLACAHLTHFLLGLHLTQASMAKPEHPTALALGLLQGWAGAQSPPEALFPLGL